MKNAILLCVRGGLCADAGDGHGAQGADGADVSDGFEAWCAKSEAALAVSERGPLGPYKSVGTILKGSGRNGDFDRDVVHNPSVFVDGEKVIERLVAQDLISLSESRTLKEPGRCLFGRDEIPEHVKLRVAVTPLNAGGKGGKEIKKEFVI